MKIQKTQTFNPSKLETKDGMVEIKNVAEFIISRLKEEEILPQGKDLIIGKKFKIYTPDGAYVPELRVYPLTPDGSDMKRLQDLIPNYIKRLKYTRKALIAEPSEEEIKKVSENLDWEPVIWTMSPTDFHDRKIEIYKKIIHNLKERFQSSNLICYEENLNPSLTFDEKKSIKIDDAKEVFQKWTTDPKENEIFNTIHLSSKEAPSREEGWNFICEKDYNAGYEIRIALTHFRKINPFTPPSVDDVIEYFKQRKDWQPEITKSGLKLLTTDGDQITIVRDKLKRRIDGRIKKWRKSITQAK